MKPAGNRQCHSRMQHRLVYGVEHWLPRKQAHARKMNAIVNATKTRICDLRALRRHHIVIKYSYLPS